ncbi:hypothetical protein COV42_01570 [Candidatus Campbellbacteria bacterium CG11_big_fil_rev_8_21_14_0_20_44_21]|uniref:Trigger factor n=1 Tax=Candidatus Campbellbacteria bacterium CG22_combo_CG10-13_8_21_14_all_43_18 TaxID=1974530 RepID=A0A2H0DXY8_9BACT|nr:MAG: hypothetical protein COW82_01970 [Candidatus Campbellbacteria bacterium CG22_combo_CG10-13_8_21_14_all_43_18]PIR24282.1 MAG: hypothetical protein COV42_01570 [Candidatus Campbellbacteria bacterium CG11_big_fil_rev_8_21_14_0_20_44_21]
MFEIKIKKLPKSEIEIEGQLPFSFLEEHKVQALKKLGANLRVPGFREGHLPEKIILGKVGEANLLKEMAELALSKTYPQIIIQNKIDPIEKPNVSITKLARGNPLGFKMRLAVMPEIKLPDYQEIAEEIFSKKETFEATKEDKENLIGELLESQKEEDGKKSELSDEFVKNLGDFKNLEDFNKKIEEGIKKEKEFRDREKKRLRLMEEIIAKTELGLPDIITESELQKMIAGFKADIERVGLKTDGYLKESGKTEDDLRKEWRGEAEKRAKGRLILNKIAITESLVANEKEIEHEVEHILSHHPKADRERAKLYAEQMLTNEKVFRFLEKQEKLK